MRKGTVFAIGAISGGLLVAGIYSTLRDPVEPATADVVIPKTTDTTPSPAKTILPADPAPEEPKSEDLGFTDDVSFIKTDTGAMVMTPFGPCGNILLLAPNRFGVNVVGQEIDIYSTSEEAIKAAGTFCDQWYQQEKANRAAAQDIQKAWQAAHPPEPSKEAVAP
jgi:hypothetical protein